MLDWAKVLYADANAASYFSGIGVHWYGGLNTNNLNRTHELAPDKFILATEACNCGGVVYQKPDLAQWWSRAESLGLDILEVGSQGPSSGGMAGAWGPRAGCVHADSPSFRSI